MVVSLENRYKLTAIGEFLHKLLFNDASAYLLADLSMLETSTKVGRRSALSLVFALQRNVKLKSVTSEKVDFSSFIKLVGCFMRNIRPTSLKLSLGGENNYRSGDVPLSFIVIDGEITVFEISNSAVRTAFVSTDKEAGKILTHLFWDLWNGSQILHM